MNPLLANKKVTFAVIIVSLLAALGLFVWAVTTQRFELRRKAVSGEVTPTPPAVGVGCSSKNAYRNGNPSMFDYTLSQEIPNGGAVSPGEIIIYTINIQETNSGAGYTTTDTLDPNLEFINYQSTDYCSVNSSTNTVSCPGQDTGRSGVRVSIKAKVKENTPSMVLNNSAQISLDNGYNTNCSISLNVIPGSSAEPSSSPSPSPSENPSTCAPTDINKDGLTDLTDYSILAADFFKSTPTNPRSDINLDGIVDITDYSLLVSHFFANTGACQ